MRLDEVVSDDEYSTVCPVSAVYLYKNLGFR